MHDSVFSRLLSLVKFSHTIFALPFVLVIILVAASTHPLSIEDFVLIILAVVSARTAAMAFNRIVDRKIDADNPRTKERELVRGALKPMTAWLLVIASSILFHLCAFGLGQHCLVLAPFVLALLFGYSLTKRFTACSHLVLGVCLALAPGGAWYALTAEIAFLPIPLMLAVVFWVAGFDIIYALQDVDVDSARGLYSIPARYGTSAARSWSRWFHALSIISLALFGYLANLGITYFCGVALFALLLANQHRVLCNLPAQAIEPVFFSRNGMASIIVVIATYLDLSL